MPRVDEKVMNICRVPGKFHRHEKKNTHTEKICSSLGSGGTIEFGRVGLTWGDLEAFVRGRRGLQLNWTTWSIFLSHIICLLYLSNT